MDERMINELKNLPLLILLSCSLLTGLLLGYVYFRTLRASVSLILQRGNPLQALALGFGRLAILGGVFYFAAMASGFALLATLAGVLCAKTFLLRAYLRPSE